MAGLRNCEKGQGLAGAIVGAGVLGIIVLGVTSMFTMQSREMNALTQRMAVLDSNRVLTEALKTSPICTFMVTNAGPWLPLGATLPLHFDVTYVNSRSAPDIRFEKLLGFASATAPALVTAGQPLIANAPSPPVDKIEITEITGDPNGNQFFAVLRISFRHEGSMRTLRPIDLRIPLTTTTSGTTKNITACDVAAETSQILIAQHVTAAGVDGDSVPTVWAKKTLNSLQFNAITGSSLNNSEITLPPGTYHVQASISLRGDGNEEARTRLFNVTTGATVCFGSSVRYPGSDEDTTLSMISCGVTLVGTEVLRVDFVSRKGNAISGWARWAAPAGSQEVHANVLVRRL